MNFLAPLFLFGALAVAIPVVLHLVRRTTRQRTVFSSLMFLRPSPPRLNRRSRFEHLLLLLLRCLALALVAFAFARPFVQEATVSEADAGLASRIVVLVDSSASMQRAGLWAAARQRAEEVLGDAGAGDRVALVSFGRQASVLMDFDQWSELPPDERVAQASARLEAIEPGWESTQMGLALSRASELLEDTGEDHVSGPKRVVVISDLQEGARLETLQSMEWPAGMELVLEPVTARTGTNASLQLLTDAADSERTGEPVVRVRVSNAAGSTRELFLVGWAAADGIAHVGDPVEVYVPPGQSRVVPLPLPAETTGLAQIHLIGDDEPFDNRVYVIPPEKQQLTVLYLGAESASDSRQPLFFLERALPESPRLGVKVVARAASDNFSPAEAREAALIFVTDPLSAAQADELRAVAVAGKTIVVAPRSPDAAAGLARLLGLDSLPMDEARVDSYAMLAEIDFSHPLFAPFADPRFSDFTKLHFWRHRRLNTDGVPGARLVARFDSGDPAIVEIPTGNGRVLLLTSGWAPGDSQLAVSSKFVPLLFSMLELAGSVTSTPSQHQVGDSLPLASSEGTWSVKLPDGSVATMTAGSTRFEGTALPGVYELTQADAAARFAVNLDGAETRLEPLSTDDFERLGAPLARDAIQVADAEERMIVLHGMETEARQKLWRWFIGATLLVLLVESALAGWTARRSTAQGGLTP